MSLTNPLLKTVLQLLPNWHVCDTSVALPSINYYRRILDFLFAWRQEIHPLQICGFKIACCFAWCRFLNNCAQKCLTVTFQNALPTEQITKTFSIYRTKTATFFCMLNGFIVWCLKQADGKINKFCKVWSKINFTYICKTTPWMHRPRPYYNIILLNH